MVYHKIEHEADPLFPEAGGEPEQVFGAAVARVDLRIAVYGIPPVIRALRPFGQGHQVQKVDPQLLEVGQPGLQPAEVLAEPVHIQLHAHPFPVLVPVARPQAAQVLHLQFPGTGCKEGSQFVDQCRKGLFPMGVKGMEELADQGEIRRQPLFEKRPQVCRARVVEPVSAKPLMYGALVHESASLSCSGSGRDSMAPN